MFPTTCTFWQQLYRIKRHGYYMRKKQRKQNWLHIATNRIPEYCGYIKSFLFKINLSHFMMHMWLRCKSLMPGNT